VIGLIVQVGVLACLAATVGLDGTGWLAGLVFGAVVCAVLDTGLQRASRRALGPADWVTLSRAALAGGVIALVADSFGREVPAGVLAVIASVALSLDWVDGQVARRTGTVSDLGARFDMEVDAALVLALSVFGAHEFGVWVLAIGLMRYAFVAAMWVLPWMRGTLPPRYWRKVVAATQGIVLVVAVSGVLPRSLAVNALLAALALLVESFGRDVLWLWHHRPALVPAFGGGVRARARLRSR
jgi:phosphatidylglycerophosphate synthase